MPELTSLVWLSTPDEYENPDGSRFVLIVT